MTLAVPSPVERSFLRGGVADHSKEEERVGHFHRLLAEMVTGPHPQDCTLLFTGDKGTGKSYATISMAYSIAKEIAKIRHRDESKWPRYFNLHDCVAIINREQIVDLMAKAKPYQILIFDDAAAGWDAREFAKEGNKFLNHILEISRTRRNIILISTPQAFLLDKVPRQLTVYRCHMEGAYFSYDPPFSTIKIYKQKVSKDGKVKNMFPMAGRTKFAIYICHRPPRDISDEYNRLRDLAAAREYERMQEAEAQEHERREHKESRREQKQDLIDKVIRDREAGVPIPEIMRAYGVNRNFIYRYT